MKTLLTALIATTSICVNAQPQITIGEKARWVQVNSVTFIPITVDNAPTVIGLDCSRTGATFYPQGTVLKEGISKKGSTMMAVWQLVCSVKGDRES
jgi:hypothetical protein